MSARGPTEEPPAAMDNAAVIREYDAATDAQSLRACFVDLQEFERTLEPDLPSGAAVADAYLRWMLGRCATWDGAVFVATVGDAAVGFVSVWARVPQDELSSRPASTPPSPTSSSGRRFVAVVSAAGFLRKRNGTCGRAAPRR